MPPQKNKRKRRSGGRNRTSSQSSVEIQVTQTEVSHSQNQLAQPILVKPRKDFLCVLKCVNAKGSWTPNGEEVFTVRQICLYLTEYIKQKQLYDTFNPVIVYCQNDPLGKVFGVEKFSRHEALKYVLSQCDQVMPRQKHDFTQPTSQLPTYDTTKPVEMFLSPKDIVSNPEVYSPQKYEADVLQRKRQKHDSGSDDLEAGTSASLPLRRRQSSFSIVYNTDTGDDWSFAVVEVEESGEESVYSVQSKETCWVESSSDEYWFLDGSGEDDIDGFSLEMNEQGISVEFNQSTDPPFQEEYEIEEHSFGESGGEYDTDGSESPIEEIFVVYDGSDEDFWADSESSDCESESTSDDEELCDADKWLCIQCEFLNTPLRRYCDKCWALRPNWLSEKQSMVKSSETDYFGIGHTRAESMETLPASDIDLSDFDEPSLLKQYDSGLGGSLAHLSQEYSNGTELHSKQKEEIVKSASSNTSAVIMASVHHEEEIVKSASSNTSAVIMASSHHEEEIVKSVSSNVIDVIMANSQYEEEIVKSASCPLRKPNVRTTENTAGSKDVNSACVNLSIKFSEHNPALMKGYENTQSVISPKYDKTSIINPKYDKTSSPIKCKNTVYLSQQSPGKVVHSPRKNRKISESSQDLCTICMVKPKEASIIHGKTGHQVCCYVCAKRLKRKGKHCPVCRRPIQKVIKNYLV